MEPPGSHGAARRDSFVKFAASKLLAVAEGEAHHVAAPSSQSVRDLAGTWERFSHATNLLGYAMCMSFFALLYLIFLSSLQWAEPGGEGVDVPVLAGAVMRDGIWMSSFALYTIGSWANIAQYTEFADCGTKYAWVNLTVGAVTTLLLYGSHALVSEAGVDTKYWVGDVLLALFWIVVFLASEITIRAKWAANDHLKLAVASATPLVPDAASAASGTDTDAAASVAEAQKTLADTLLGLVPALSFITVAALYPLLVVPAFIVGTVTNRMLICLLLHPFLLEAGEALGRSTKGGITAGELNGGEITMEQAERRIVQSSLTSSGFKQLMAIYRRLMLLNMGTPEATIAAVVAASIVEALERGFLVEIDRALRRLRNLPELQGDELRLQRLVWMCDQNQSAIAELNGILVSSFAQIVLERHSQLLALGYAVGEPLDATVVFVQLMVELTLEVGVDMVAMWAETEHGIPVTHYFRLVRSAKYFVLHASIGVFTTTFALHSFVRHPNFA